MPLSAAVMQLKPFVLSQVAAAVAVFVFVFADGFVEISVDNIFKDQKILEAVSQNTFKAKCEVEQI